MSKGISEKISGTVSVGGELEEFEYGADLTAGDPVQVYDDGVAKVKNLDSAGAFFTSAPVSFKAGAVQAVQAIDIPNSINHAVFYKLGASVYVKIGDPTYPTAELLVANDNANQLGLTWDSVNSKIIFAYNKTSDGFMYTRTGTISGTTVTLGAETSTGIAGSYPVIEFDENAGKAVLVYQRTANTYARIVNVTGTVTSYEAELNLGVNADAGQIPTLTYSPAVMKSVYISVDVPDVNATVLTIAAGVLTAGTPVVIHSNSGDQIDSTYDPVSEKVILVMRESPPLSAASVLTITGTTVSVSATASFHSGTTILFPAVVYNGLSGEIDVIFKNGGGGGSQRLDKSSGVVSGGVLVFSPQVQLDVVGVGNQAKDVIYSASAKHCIVFSDTGSDGISIIFGSSLVIDETLFFGVAQTTALTGTTNDVALIGDTSTVHAGTAGDIAYVQADGSLGTTVTAYPAGRYISATEINLTKTP